MARWQVLAAVTLAISSHELGLPPDVASQAPADGRLNDVTILVEPAAGGVRYLRRLSAGFSVGAMLTGGPRYAVVMSGGSADVRTWGTIYPVLAWATPGGLQVSLSPVGGAVVVGNDFGTIYPSGQMDLELGRGRFRFGTAVHVVRIAGGNGTGTYRALWTPLRIGVSTRRSSP